jgi:hypothetical protein
MGPMWGGSGQKIIAAQDDVGSDPLIAHIGPSRPPWADPAWALLGVPIWGPFTSPSGWLMGVLWACLLGVVDVEMLQELTNLREGSLSFTDDPSFLSHDEIRDIIAYICSH